MALRKAGKAFSAISDAIDFYNNKWTHQAKEMAQKPMTWCILMSAAGGQH